MDQTQEKALLIAKARGFTHSIEKMTDTQRGRLPGGEYGEDYNRLRKLLIDHLTKFHDQGGENFLPPKVAFREGQKGRKYCQESYAEIHTYCEQIAQLLTELK